MKIGFTGTRNGLTKRQFEALKQILTMYWKDQSEFHHGQCIGSDEMAHNYVKQLETVPIHIHPPALDTLIFDAKPRKMDKVYKERTYLERNKDIVDATELLIGCPESNEEKQRSGTWSTIRYARKNNKSVIIIFPDGAEEFINKYECSK